MADIALGEKRPRLMMLIFNDTINIISLGDKRWKDSFELRQSRGIAPSLTVFKYSLKSCLNLRFTVFFRVPPSSDRFIVVYVLGKGRCFDPDVPHLGREMEIRPSVEISKRQTLAGLRWCQTLTHLRHVARPKSDHFVSTCKKLDGEHGFESLE